MITIVIPNRSDLRISQLMDSLEISGLKKYRESIRVVISLNNPSPCVLNLSNRIKTKFPGQIYVEITDEPGISKAKNQVILKYLSQTDYYLFIDSDCTVKKNYLQKFLEIVERDNPDVIKGYTNFTPISNSYLSHLNCRMRDLSYVTYPLSLLSPNIAIKKDIFVRCGIYDTKIKFGDDLEFGQRARSLKLMIVNSDDIVINHQDDKSFFKKTIKTWWGYGQDRGFRLARNFHFNNYNFGEKMYLILGIKKHWRGLRIDDILFYMFYLVTARISAGLSIMNKIHNSNEYFERYPSVDGLKNLAGITKGPELP